MGKITDRYQINGAYGLPPEELYYKEEKSEFEKLSDRIASLEAEKERLLSAVKKAYRKHHLNDESIGWDELSDILMTAIVESIGDDNFVLWLDDLRKEVEK